MIAVSNLYARRAAFKLVNINFEAQQGSILTIVGPNGCGKTTLLECVAGLQKVEAGKITIKGVDVTSFPPEKRKVGYVPADYALFPNMTVQRNIRFALKKAGDMGSNELVKIARMLQIENLMDRNVESLSSGQRQRVALARALASKPNVLLLDEPCSALDPPTKEMFRTRIKDMLKDVIREISVPIIYTTHDLLEANVISDRIAVMDNGRLEQIGRADEVFENPNSKFVSEFLGYNVLEGNVVSIGAGRVSIRVGNVMLEAEGFESPLRGKVTVAIRPQDVILSTREEVIKPKWKKCRCNILKGTVEKMYMAGSIVRAIVNVDDVKLKVDVTSDWLEESNIKVGDRVFAQIKASRVKILQDRMQEAYV